MLPAQRAFSIKKAGLTRQDAAKDPNTLYGMWKTRLAGTGMFFRMPARAFHT